LLDGIETQPLSIEEIQLIDVAVAVNKALEPNYMPSVVKVGSGQMENS
tara:strand:+ start:263 stop:406 length:144 start_codon:yes stop_codon:yes gene_type:complete